MKQSKTTPSVITSISKRCPPWFGYVSETVSTIKIGKYFVTVEVVK